MKRFEFSLNKLKGYKQQVLDREKNSLAHLRRQQQQYIDDKYALEQKLKQSNEEYILRSSKGMTVMQITTFKGYHRSLSAQIKELERSIAVMEEKVQRQLNVVIEATKEVSSLKSWRTNSLRNTIFSG